jgi:uncharacterized Rmd1/YagE family protein
MAYDPIKRKEDYLKNKERDLATNKKWREVNKEHKQKIGREYYYKTKEENNIKYLLKYAKARATKKGLEYSLIESDILIPEICPIMKVPMVSKRYRPSIDRIDPTKGYTKENIRIISSLANSMKWDSSKEELIQFCNSVLEGGYY